jgi:predicted DNA-binding protein
MAALVLAGLVGIKQFEVEQVLYAEQRWPRPAYGPSGVSVLTIWARTRRGRPLIVAVRRVGEREWLIVERATCICGSGRNSCVGRSRRMAELPRRPEEIREFMESLEFDGEAAEDEVPPRDLPIMVVRSLRLPSELDQKLKAAARRRGVRTSTLVREWIELELTALEDDQPISRADALRALATLRPMGAA